VSCGCDAAIDALSGQRRAVVAYVEKTLLTADVLAVLARCFSLSLFSSGLSETLFLVGSCLRLKIDLINTRGR
jgi:hypothetical protein